MGSVNFVNNNVTDAVNLVKIKVPCPVKPWRSLSIRELANSVWPIRRKRVTITKAT